jgi:surface polysaccharide O-acyltransferase-like enzyme
MAIVGIHAQTAFVGDEAVFRVDQLIQEWATSWVLRVGLPVLSACSGYLMLQRFRFEWSWYLPKLKRRVSSLIVPFISVSTLTVLLDAGLQELSLLAGFFSQPLIANWSVSEWIDQIVIHPLNYPLYFLRDLFVVALLSPLLGSLFRQKVVGLLALGGLAVLWVGQPNPGIFNIRILAWFSLGGFVALPPSPILSRLSWKTVAAGVAVWLAFKWWGTYLTIESGVRPQRLSQFSKILGVFLFFRILWQSTTAHPLRIVLRTLSIWCFPLFILHNPVVNLLKKVAAKLTGDFPGGLSLAWGAAWLLAIVILTRLAPVLERFGGRPWAVVTGGRTSHPR